MIKKFMLIFILCFVPFVGAMEFDIDDYYPMSVTTSRFTSGALFTSAPTYIVYEMVNSTGAISTIEIITVTALTADFDSKTGLHVGTFKLTTAAGFNAGNAYIIFYQATVDSVTGGFSETFKIQPAIAATAAAQTTAQADLDTITGAAGALIDDGTGAGQIALTSGKIDEVTTLTGHTPQTGDSYARIGAAGAGLTNIDLPDQTMDITGSLSGSVGSVTGAVGSVTGNVGGTINGFTAPAKAEIQVEANDALIANNLDHLMKTAVANNADMTVEVPDGTVMSNIMSSTSDTSTFTVADDSLQGISEGAAGGGATAQQVWEYNISAIVAAGFAGTLLNDVPSTAEFEARTLTSGGYFAFGTDPVELLDSGGSAGTSASELVDDTWNEALTGGSPGQAKFIMQAILVDTDEIGAAGVGLTDISLKDQTMDITGTISSVTGNIGGNLAGSVGGSIAGNLAGSIGSLGVQAQADVNAEVVDVLKVDTIASLTAGLPPVNPTFEEAIMYTYWDSFYAKYELTATTWDFYAADELTVLYDRTVSDDTVTFTRGEVTAP